jgi:tetratricopeptide (TPR) repeat protein
MSTLCVAPLGCEASLDALGARFRPMHLVVALSSEYVQSGAISPPLAWSVREADRLARALEPRAHVLRLDLSRGALEQLELSLASLPEPLESLHVFAFGLLAIAPGRPPSVLLDSDRLGTLPLERLADCVRRLAVPSTIGLDLSLFVGDAPSGVIAANIGDVLYESGASTLLCLRQSAGEAQSSPLASLVETLALDCQGRNIDFASVQDTVHRLKLAVRVITGHTAAWVPASPVAVEQVDALRASQPLLVASGVETSQRVEMQSAAFPRFETPAGDFVNPPFESGVRATLGATLAAPTPALGSSVGAIARESLLEKGLEQEAAGNPKSALDHYKRGLLLLGAERGSERAKLYVAIARVARTLERHDLVRDSLEKALEINPSDTHALALASETALAAGDFPRVEELERKRLEFARGPEERAAIFKSLARMWTEQANDPRRATRALKEWHVEQPEEKRPLQLLASLSTLAGDHNRAIHWQRLWAERLLDDPRRRAQVLESAGRTALDECRDPALGADLLFEAIQSDPGCVAAFERLESLLGEQGDHDRLARAYELVLSAGKPESVRSFAPKLARLSQERLGNLEKARSAWELAVTTIPDDPALRASLSEAYAELGQLDHALEQCRAGLLLAPRDADGYKRVFELSSRMGSTDLMYQAASALDYLGEADVNESVLADAHRPDGLLAVRAVLGEQDWISGGLCPDRDPELEAFLRFLAPYARRAKLEMVTRSKELPELPEQYRQDPESSTTTLAKSLKWASRVLGVKTPMLYVLPDAPRETSVALKQDEAVIASRALGSGFSLPELAFLWGRQLAVLRPEWELLAHYFLLAELVELWNAAARVAQVAPSNAMQVDPLASALERALGASTIEELKRRIRPLHQGDVATRLGTYMASAERAGARAGLLACGSISVAADMIERFPAGAELPAEQLIQDLLLYSLSPEYTALRERLGVSV